MNLSIATISDINELKKMDIPFNFKKNIELEINSGSHKSFEWIVAKEKEQIIGFHRTMIVSDIGFLSGIFINDKVESKNPWIAHSLVLYSLESLKKSNIVSLVAWDSDIESHKSKILMKNDFYVSKSLYRRLIFSKNGISSLLNSKLEPTIKWDIASESDSLSITKLAKNKQEFLAGLVIKNHEYKNWIVKRINGVVEAAICWWSHGNTLEVHFSISNDPTLDIIDGIINILNLVEKKEELEFFKINLESERLLTMLRLSTYKPYTYKEGYNNFCLVMNNL
ncbi:hypothetical protein [Exiguobacterium sp. ERU656]|uniref:hypothetical protein n=1 Tax=Exiguobacterium sp. ERU656 TaxID=2751217 RepID=UPI001BE8005E|nr:hypothetical protein [Exiguobacterium sp. ERU656]